MGKVLRTTAQTATIMAVLTLMSKLLGFIREMVMANFFGTSYITDAYVMAITVPGVILGGTLSAVAVAYTPILSKLMEEEGQYKANQFTMGILNLLAIISILLGALGLIFSDQIVSIFASGFVGRTATLTSFFLKISFFYLIFSATADVLEAYLRYKGVFIPQVAFGFIQNFILIGTIAISAFTTYYFLVFGYLLVYFIRLLIMGFISKKYDLKFSCQIKLENTLKKIAVLSVPVFIGSSMAQINTFVDKTLASGLPEGSIAALNYGNLLVTMISGLTISIMTTIIYPKLAQSSAQNDIVRTTNIIEKGINLIIIIAIPCTFGAMIYSQQVVQIVYERGAFDALATFMTGKAFFYYVIGMPFSSISILLTQVCYSKQNMKTPMIFGGIGVIMNVALNLLLVKPMAHSGLAFATSISAIFVASLFYLSLRKQYTEIKQIRCHIKLVKIVIAAALSVGTSYFIYIAITSYLGAIIVSRMVQLSIAVIIAGIVYLFLLYMMRIEELNLLKDIIKRKK